MNRAIFIGQSLDGHAHGIHHPFYGVPSEGEAPPALDFPWSQPAGDGRYNLRRNSRALASETWVRSTDAEHYISTNDDDFHSGFGLDSDPAEPTLFAQEHIVPQSVDEATPLDTADFISHQQDFGPEAFPDGNEAYDMTPSEPSPASTSSARRTTPTSATTPTDSVGTPSIKQHRERNRVAARKCRQKAKQNFAGLQRREKELSQQNKVLHSHVGGLRDEILDLKNEILRHSHCNSSVIQNYITNAARRQSG
ncbi:hypothetical protein F5Y12DRAFT_131528 [Xylaria sp. FL1777]|nr:hypothetical protein F5Y12DRAFT_131528 [Xylaria sp. FL1777]